MASARTVAATPHCTAIATASAAIAATHGYDDGEHIPLDLHLAVLQQICAAVEPVTADLERGYGDVAETIRAAVDLGVVGANLEDAMCPATEMCQHVAAAVAAGEARNVPIVLNARTDVYLADSDDDEDAKCSESIGRGTSYLEAGADCIFVPGCTDTSSISRLVESFGPGRLSLLAVPGISPPDVLETLGVARLSHGPYPHQHSLEALATYAQRAAY